MRREAVWALAASLVGSMALAQGPTGPEFRVNSTATASQHHPSIALLGSGTHLVAWTQESNGSLQPFARVFDGAGAPLGPQFPVSENHPITLDISVAASDGGFVVVWSAQGGPNVDVLGRRFDATGSPHGSEFRVSAGVPSRDGMPRVASAADGGFVVVWTNYSGADGSGFGIFGRRYTAAAAPLGPPFQVNTYTTGRQGRIVPGLAVGDDGRFAVVWASNRQAGNSDDLFGQLFDNVGNRRGTEFRVNESTLNSDDEAAVSFVTAGGVVVSWSGTPGILLAPQLMARRVDATGIPAGNEYPINDPARPGAALGSWLVPLAAGRTVAVWEKWLSFPWRADLSLRARLLDADGTPLGEEFRVGSRILASLTGATAASDGAGGFVAGSVTPLPGGAPARTDLFARRFAILAPAAATLVDAGNGLLEPGESAVWAPAWRNFDDAPVVALTSEARAFAGPGSALRGRRRTRGLRDGPCRSDGELQRDRRLLLAGRGPAGHASRAALGRHAHRGALHGPAAGHEHPRGRELQRRAPGEPVLPRGGDHPPPGRDFGVQRHHVLPLDADHARPDEPLRPARRRGRGLPAAGVRRAGVRRRAPGPPVLPVDRRAGLAPGDQRLRRRQLLPGGAGDARAGRGLRVAHARSLAVAALLRHADVHRPQGVESLLPLGGGTGAARRGVRMRRRTLLPGRGHHA